MTPDRSGLFLPKKRGSRGTGAPCKQDRGINAEYPSKHHRKLVWTKLANDYLTLTPPATILLIELKFDIIDIIIIK
jgi:hypothetical protein